MDALYRKPEGGEQREPGENRRVKVKGMVPFKKWVSLMT